MPLLHKGIISTEHWLFIASTPRHLYQAVAVTLNAQVASSLVTFDLPSESPLVSQAVDGHYFANTLVLTRPNKSSERKQAFKQQKQISALIDKIKPSRVLVGNDYQPLCQ